MPEATTSGHAIETILLEERRYEPPPDFAAQANATPDIYDQDFEQFWETEGRERVTWFQDFGKLCEWELPYSKWYVGGQLNVTYNCVDRHVEAGNGDKVAYHWEGEPEDERRTITFADLQRQEDGEHCDIHAQRPQHHVRVEDREREQEPPQPVVDVGGRELERAGDARRA